MGLLINEEDIMLTYTYIEHGKFELREKPEPEIVNSREAIVRVTLGSICTSDLHIKHGSVPRAVPGITVGHEMVGVVEKVGADVTSVKPGDRVTVNVETFCGECFFCRRGYVNNCTDPNGGWALGCPKTCRKHITHKQSLFVADCIRNTVQSLVSIRNSDIFCLTAVNAAT